MSASGPTVLVFGILGQTPVAGVAWQVLQYLEGLRRLGYDVYYLEDTGVWPGHPDQPTPEQGIVNTVRYIQGMMEWCGMGERWAYVAPLPGKPMYGLAEARVREILARADALLNLTGSTVLHEACLRVPVRIYLETDPVAPQIEVAKGGRFAIAFLESHTHHFSYGENFGRPDCGVPIDRFTYHPTRPPIVLDWWQGNGSGQLAVGSWQRAKASCQSLCYTTIASWRQTGKDIEWNGQVYRWSKHEEFLKFIDLPRHAAVCFELALAGVEAAELELLRAHGWQTTPAGPLSADILAYRRYIQDSRGEFTVAKDQNIRLRSGWFSDRSACYLAAGRPVITQETGFSRILPTGGGLFAFTRLEDILQALEAIERDWPAACRAAREVAAEYFAAGPVVGHLMSRAGL